MTNSEAIGYMILAGKTLEINPKIKMSYDDILILKAP
jgi:hypothetical protein